MNNTTDPNELTINQKKILASAMYNAMQDLSLTDYFRMFFRHIKVRPNHVLGEYTTVSEPLYKDAVVIPRISPEANWPNDNFWLQAVREAVTSAMPLDDAARADIEHLRCSDNQTMRHSWTPDAEFLSMYSYKQLLALAKQLEIPMDTIDEVSVDPNKTDPKCDLLSHVALAFKLNLGRTRDWLPDQYKSVSMWTAA